MARAGFGSRRENERLIAAGRVYLNGRLARLGDKADPQVDRIEVDGKALRVEQEQYTYILLNKPRGVISSLEDELQQARTTVRDLIAVCAAFGLGFGIHSTLESEWDIGSACNLHIAAAFPSVDMAIDSEKLEVVLEYDSPGLRLAVCE